MSGPWTELNKTLDQVGKDKGIDKATLIGAIEEAMITVARKKFGPFREIEAKFNEELGEVELFQFKTIVENVQDSEKELSLSEAQHYDEGVSLGDVIGIKMDTTLLSRIAAQTAKQVLVQKVRDAERGIIYNEFQHRKGEIITGLIRRVDRGAVIIDLGRTEGYMPQNEQIQGELYNPGDRIQAYLKDVQLTPKGPRIILSRACPEYLIALFHNEVPEIREGLVEIKGAARDPGIRAKIAVISKDSDVDPIGACVGVRGARVQNVVQELKGERIDIIPWNEDISRFVVNALIPAEIQKVIIDDENKTIQVVVNDSNLSLAIGKRGQNVRLASQLTQWKLDIISETAMAKKLSDSKNQLMMINGITDTLAMSLYQSGYEYIRDVADTDISLLAEVPGFDEQRAEDVVRKARELIDGGVEEQLRIQAESAEANSEKKDSETIESKLRAAVVAHEKSKQG